MAASSGSTGVAERIRSLVPAERRWARAGIVIGGLVLCYAALFGALTLVRDEPVHWARPIGSMVGPLIGSSLALWWQRRRLGGGARLREYQQALRSGRLPTDVDPSVWGPLLAREARSQRRGTVGALVFLFSCAALALALLRPEEAGRWYPLVVVGVLAVPALLGWLMERQRRRLSRLAGQLPTAAATDGA